MNIKLILAQLQNIRSEELIYFFNFQYSSHPGLNVSDHEVVKEEYCDSLPPAPGRNASPSYGYPPAVCRRYPFILLVEEGQSGVKFLV